MFEFLKMLSIIFAILTSSLAFSTEKNSNKHILTSKIKVLIVDGFSNHDWRQTSLLVRQIMEKSQLFTVSVSTIPAMDDSGAGSNSWEDWQPNFSAYDVVIQNTNNLKNKKLQWPLAAQQNLERYVSRGGGLFILHSANNAFPNWLEYNRMIGLGWRKANQGIALTITDDNQVKAIPSGEGKNTYHGPRTNQVIYQFTDHPITEGLPKAWLTPNLELYKYARGVAENVTILSYAIDDKTNIKWPTEWTIDYGKGRVYNSSFGHLWKGETYPDSYKCVGFQTSLIRATQWLSTNKVDYAIPNNYPSKEKISLVTDPI